MRLNEILDTISRAIALTANLPISFGQRREPKASLADDECPLLPSEDVDRIILPRGDGLQERYEVVGGVASLTIEPEPASASGHFSEEEIHQQAMRTEWLQRVVDEQTIPEDEPPRVRIRNREIQWSGTVVYPRQEMAEWLQAVVDRTAPSTSPILPTNTGYCPPEGTPTPTLEQAMVMLQELQETVDRIVRDRAQPGTGEETTDAFLEFLLEQRQRRRQRQSFRGSPPLPKHGIWHYTTQCCLNCAYFMAGKPSICNAFHTITDSTAINDCPDFELK